MERKLKQLMAAVLRIREDEISDSLTMKNTESWDSFKHMELVVSIEELVGEELTFDEIVAMKNFREIKKIVSKKGYDI